MPSPSVAGPAQSSTEKKHPNVCIITVPEGKELVSVTATIRKIGQLCGGTPVSVPHCTMQYLYDVNEAGIDALQRELPHFARRFHPFPVEVTGILTDWGAPLDFPQDRLIVAVRKTETLCTIYMRLANLARAIGIDPSPIEPADWVPHIKILEDYRCSLTGAASKILPLTPHLSFTARSLWISVLDENGDWRNRGRVTLIHSPRD